MSRSTAAASPAFSSSTSRSSPKILIAICALVPVSNSSTAAAIGCVKVSCTPGKSSSRSCMAMTRSSLVPAVSQSSSGFRSTKISALFTGSACAPTSPRPMRETTCVTSGKRRNSRSIRWTVSVACVREIDGAIVARTSIVPSFSVGMNSRPRNGKIAAPATISAAVAPITARRWSSAHSSSGR